MEKSQGQTAGLLGRVRIASPCPASWEAMEGDERVRFCRLCDLNVYNLSEMTRGEAEALVARAEGRLCARLYRRADGTVLTKDCPTGLRAARRRVRRAAAAVFAALAGLWTAAAGQNPAPKGARGEQAVVACEGGGRLKIRRGAPAAGEEPSLKGVALDPAGASIPGARVTLKEMAAKNPLTFTTDDEGTFSFLRPEPGTYTFGVEHIGFARLEVKELVIAPGETLNVEFVLAPSGEMVTVGVLVVDDFVDRPGGMKVISGDIIRKLPIPR